MHRYRTEGLFIRNLNTLYFASAISFLVVFCSTFSRQLLEIIKVFVSREATHYLALIFSVSLLWYGLRDFMRVNASARLALVILSVFFAAAWFALEIPEERFHLLLYGSVGAVWSLVPRGRGLLSMSFIALLAGLITAICDEGLQYFLPYRVGDPRDVTLDMAGVFLGLGFVSVYEGAVSRN